MWGEDGPPKQPNLEALLTSDLWSNIVVLWMLCGGAKDDTNWMEIIFYADDYPERDYGFVSVLSRKLNEAQSEGRFGNEGGTAIHPLRAIDWMESENIVKFIEDAEERDFDMPQWFFDLIGVWKNKRQDFTDCPIEIDFKEYAKADFWTLEELTALLFGELSSKNYSRKIYHKYSPQIEDRIGRISYHLWAYAEKGMVDVFFPEFDDDDAYISRVPKRPKLIFDERLCIDPQDSLYAPIDLLGILRTKGYPVPGGLIESLKEGNFEVALQLLNQFRISMINSTNSLKVRSDVEGGHSLEGELSSRVEEDTSIYTGADIIFERKGDYWRVAHEGDRLTLIGNFKGMNYICLLLENPDKDLHCLKLCNLLQDDPRPESIGNIFLDSADYEKPEESGSNYFESSLRNKQRELIDEILDGKAIQNYKTKMAKLTDERDEIQTTIDDPARCMEETQAIQREIDVIKDRLKKDTGLRGKTRQFSSPEEKARSSVAHAIRKAINRISEHAPKLGVFLKMTIQTGYNCRYSTVKK